MVGVYKNSERRAKLVCNISKYMWCAVHLKHLEMVPQGATVQSTKGCKVALNQQVTFIYYETVTLLLFFTFSAATTTTATTTATTTTATTTTAMPPPPIKGHWSLWDPWSVCSATCGGGSQSRQRYCTDPPPQDGGADCVGESTESRTCADWGCPGDWQCKDIVPLSGSLICPEELA